MSQCEGRISDTECRKAVRDHKMKNFLKIARDKNLVQQFLDAKKNNLQLAGVNEKARDSINNINNLLTGIMAENFQIKVKEFHI